MRSLEVIYLFACMIDRLGRPIVPYIVRGIGLQGPDLFTYKFLSSLHKNTVTIQSYLLGVGVSIYLIGCLYSMSGKTLFNGCRETVRTGSRRPSLPFNWWLHQLPHARISTPYKPPSRWPPSLSLREQREPLALLTPVAMGPPPIVIRRKNNSG